ncbi:MAG: hypothetical protein GXP03_01205 [Alphaproteobacteria bacterium]|nr:hypothetical protein [Alphaproteobacteria bacterium]
MIDELDFPNGLHLLARWQSGDPAARTRLLEVMDRTIAGAFDADFATPVASDHVHVTGSVHMLVLGILFDLYGTDSLDYYTTDPERYVRTNLMVSRILGINKLYMTWALYAFTCEAVGQKMMYPDRFPPGSDPDQVLITHDTWQTLATPDFDSGIPKIINDILRVTERLTGMGPLLQISAPYSLAADIFGQEPLLADVVNDPAFVNQLLDHLADKVLGPWIEHFISVFPNGWVELSDASGSPFFIGPDNCKTMAIRAISRMIEDQPWADRVFDANYRGDFVTLARKKDRGSRRRGGGAQASGVSIEELTELKHSVCRDFVMRLEADKVPITFYTEQAIARNVPLTIGIGSSQVDKNSIPDLEIGKAEIRDTAESFVAAIQQVCKTVGRPSEASLREPWPSHIYFEDISALSQFELIGIIIETVRARGGL